MTLKIDVKCMYVIMRSCAIVNIERITLKLKVEIEFNQKNLYPEVGFLMTCTAKPKFDRWQANSVVECLPKD